MGRCLCCFLRGMVDTQIACHQLNADNNPMDQRLVVGISSRIRDTFIVYNDFKDLKKSIRLNIVLYFAFLMKLQANCKMHQKKERKNCSKFTHKVSVLHSQLTTYTEKCTNLSREPRAPRLKKIRRSSDTSPNVFLPPSFPRLPLPTRNKQRRAETILSTVLTDLEQRTLKVMKLLRLRLARPGEALRGIALARSLYVRCARGNARERIYR